MSLGTKNADYMSLYSALKGNYRKGVHRFRAMLSNPDLADEFSKSVGGVSVVLGWPIGQDDKNSQQLLALLMESPVLTQATLTWLSQWYPDYAEDADTMYGDAGRCQEIRDDPLLWRAANMDPVGAGKLIATLAGLSPVGFDDITALVASDAAMQAVIASPAALEATVSSQTAMTAVAASYVAEAAIWANPTAVQTIQANNTAWVTLTGATSAVMGKAAAMLAGLDPAGYADMAAVAASSTAMTAVAASQTAMTAVINTPAALQAVVSSSTAMTAVAASQTAMTAVAASQTAMAAVAASSTAMTAVAASQTAMTAVASSAPARNAIFASATAKAALDNSPLKTTVRAQYSIQQNNQYTNVNRRAFILKTTGSGTGNWTFFSLYDPPTASSTTSKSMGSGNSFSVYLVGTEIKTQHGGGAQSDYIDIQYIPV